MNVQKLGYLRDFPSEKDFLFENMMMGATSPPSEYRKLADGYDIHLEQEAQSCVGFGLTEGLYAAHRAQGIEKPAIASPGFIWWNSRQRHASEEMNAGTMPRLAIKQMSKVGFCPNDKWDTLNGKDLELFGKTPTKTAFRAAYDQRLTDLEYYRISTFGAGRIEAWKSALSQNCPIIFGIPIRRSYFTLGSHEVTDGGTGDMMGGHCQCALGYDEQGVFGPQTWDRNWGNDGWFKLSWKFIERFAMDTWALRVPQYWSDR